MEDRNAIRGQGFTLMVFAGLVALCSVFFILGMVVGRGQREPAVSESLAAAGQPAADGADEPDDLDFYEAVSGEEAAAPHPPPPTPAVAEVSPPPAPSPSAPEAGDTSAAVVFQLGAFGTEEAADRVAARARALDLPAFISRPEEGSGLFRVRVGPLTSPEASLRARSRLEGEGFEVVIVR